MTDRYRLAMLADWTAADWQALAYMILAVGAVVGGTWAIFNYRAERRARAAEWINSLFHDFYLDPRFKALRRSLEYDFWNSLGPLLEQRLWDRNVSLSADEVDVLGELDTLLNYFEMVMYLEDERRISKRDSLALFQYWFDVLCDDDHAPLRRYASHFGFERVARKVNAADDDHIMLYGSLRRDYGELERLGLADTLVYEGPCRVLGRLVDLGEYPAFLPATKNAGYSVAGELFRVADPRAFQVLDQFERFDPSNRSESLYQRRYLRLISSQSRGPAPDAWIYVYNRDTATAPEIESGDWADQTDTAPTE